MRTAPSLLVALVTACGGGPSAEGPALDDGSSRHLLTYRLDLSTFDRGRSAYMVNESLAFRPDLGDPSRVVSSEGDDVRKVYNRLPCQAPHPSTNDDLAEHGFRGIESMASKVPVRLESISVEMPDNDNVQNGLPDDPVRATCFAYHTSDGRWHGRFEPVATTRDDTSKSSHVTFEVHADDVDIVGIVIYRGYVSAISFVARPD